MTASSDRTSQPLSKSSRQLGDIIASGRPLAYILSAEEGRVAALLRDAAQRYFQPAAESWRWSLTEGMKCDGPGKPGPDSTDVRAALDFIASHPGPAVFLLKDFHVPMQESPFVVRRLRDLYESCYDRGIFIVISSPVRFIPEELSRVLVYFELTVPDLEELKAFLRELPAARQGAIVDTDDEVLSQMGRALQGLTLDEARFAARRALSSHGQLGLDSLPTLLEEKRLLVNRSGTIQYVGDAAQLESVGGLEVMKNWLVERRRLFRMRDTIDAELVPKGVLVMGVSGCGKSLSIKAIASCFELPLYRIDMTEIFSGRHGAPEWAFARACRMMEEIAPAVVWFDEIEMGITSSESSGEQGRIFAFFLTWMQEKSRGLFVAATANRIDLLPAEMIRKGRFDEVFFVDLPLDNERVEIFKIHLQRRGVDPSNFGLDRLTRLTKGWTGAEVEQCVVSAVTNARLQDREVNMEDLFDIASKVVPLSRTMKEQVDHIRGWARERAAPASLGEVPR
ncbi:MAG: AAA family ATPase [Methylococcaceae bacterium]|nr:AAA family ATPase [Methylococcaceae bacterium]